MAPAATRKKKKLDFPITQFVIVLAATLALFMLLGFTRRAAINYRVQQQKNQMETEYSALAQEHAQLAQRYQEVQTDAYVEQVARHELRWSRPGEKVVVIVAPPKAGAIATSVESIPALQQPDAAPQKPADRWFKLFFPPIQ